MKTNITIFILALLLSISACTNKSDSPDPNNETESMVNLAVDQDFNWSSSLEGELNVILENPLNVSTELETIQIIDEFGVVLDHKIIYNNQATFVLTLSEDSDHFVYFPVTTDRVKIDGLGQMTIELGPSVDYIYPAPTKSSRATSCTSCGTPMENGGAEIPVLGSGWTLYHQDNVPGWETTSSDGKIEFWVSGFQNVPAQEGRQFMELNATEVAALYQTLCIEPGSVIKWSVWHRGRSGVDVAVVKIGASVATAELQATMSDGNTEWGYYSGTYAVPVGQDNTVFVFESVSAAGGNNSVGNFIDNFEISCDADADGVIDPLDDYPDDPDRAYKINFPDNGKQIVAFEDLWPALGDFDFNDLVLSNAVVISKNADNELVDASFVVSIDAIGAGLENGIAMMLYDENKLAFDNNIIESVSGDVEIDNENVNGLILTNDVFETINYRYQNNGVGHTGVPDTLRFSITFVGTEIDFIPELYLFRTDDRSHEVHRSGFPVTATMNTNLFNTNDDNGNFKTATGLPWGMEIITENSWDNPIEKIDILLAYPKFETWATSNGANEPTWYLEPVEDKVVDLDFTK